MKYVFATLLLIVGTCANKRHSEKIDDLKKGIVYDNKPTVETYINTITETDLKKHLFEISSDKYDGRLTGQNGHNKICDYIKLYYSSLNIKAPDGYSNYFQIIPESYLPEGFNQTQNVVAYIKGEIFPDEYLVISAHSDHIGIKNQDIFNGADDNASGTSAILEIAQAFKLAEQHNIKPKRSIVFLHLTGEEQGLYGSRYYMQHPIFSLQNTVTNLNIDMIGRTDVIHDNNSDYIYLIGSDCISTELDFIVRKANDNFTNLELDYTYNALDDSNQYYYRSDHYNFALNNIPSVFFFNGEHEDYHQSTDTADKINFSSLKKRTQLIFATAWYIANAEHPPIKEIL